MRKYFELISVNPKTPQQLDTVAAHIWLAVPDEVVYNRAENKLMQPVSDTMPVHSVL